MQKKSENYCIKPHNETKPFVILIHNFHLFTISRNVFTKFGRLKSDFKTTLNSSHYDGIITIYLIKGTHLMVTERTMATMPRPQHKACISFGFLSQFQVVIVQLGRITSTLTILERNQSNLLRDIDTWFDAAYKGLKEQ